MTGPRARTIAVCGLMALCLVLGTGSPPPRGPAPPAAPGPPAAPTPQSSAAAPGPATAPGPDAAVTPGLDPRPIPATAAPAPPEGSPEGPPSEAPWAEYYARAERSLAPALALAWQGLRLALWVALRVLLLGAKGAVGLAVCLAVGAAAAVAACGGPAGCARLAILHGGPLITKTRWSVRAVELNMHSVVLKGLDIGNPRDFRAEHIVRLASLRVAVRSYRERPKLVTVVLDGHRITYETHLRSRVSNLEVGPRIPSEGQARAHTHGRARTLRERSDRFICRRPIHRPIVIRTGIYRRHRFHRRMLRQHPNVRRSAVGLQPPAGVGRRQSASQPPPSLSSCGRAFPSHGHTHAASRRHAAGAGTCPSARGPTPPSPCPASGDDRATALL